MPANSFGKYPDRLRDPAEAASFVTFLDTADRLVTLFLCVI
jgi:hypothetical protein